MPARLDLPLCDYSFREFFEMLGVRDILKALTGVLMEHQILLKSSGEIERERERGGGEET